MSEESDNGFTVNEEEISNRANERVEVVRAEIQEEERRIASRRGFLLETINILHSRYGIQYLFHFRKRVENAKTIEEIGTAENMLLVLGQLKQEEEQ